MIHIHPISLAAKPSSEGLPSAHIASSGAPIAASGPTHGGGSGTDRSTRLHALVRENAGDHECSGPAGCGRAPGAKVTNCIFHILTYDL